MSEPDNPRGAAQVRIYGRVQGVWFRGWTVKSAIGLGLSGWVRNRSDGSVEALFIGPPADVETMIAKCREGPPAARVDELVRAPRVSELPEKIDSAGFRQLPTL